MKLSAISAAKSLSKAYLKQSLKREQVDLFKNNLTRLLEKINEKESEEHLKNLVSEFLKDTWYKQTNEINTSGRADLVIHNGMTSSSSVGVLIEVKRPGNKSEMISPDRPNIKALHELLLYYLRERYLNDNREIKHLIVCNVYEWYIFDGADFEQLFFSDKKLGKEFKEWEAGLFGLDKTEWFYENIAKRHIESQLQEITCVHFNLKDFEQIIRKPAKVEDNKLINLYKVLSPTHLLKQSFANDANSLNREFYNELLHILGLEEIKDKGKKLISRKEIERRNEESLLENTINILKVRNKLDTIDNPEQFGANEDEQYFSLGLELCITWLNRVLFLKLLEGQLRAYHRGNREYAFLNTCRIADFDELEELFFEVLARKSDDRSASVRDKFGDIPYLNSSLFEESDLERSTIHIAALKGRLDLELYGATVLKDLAGRRITGRKNTLQYLFEFLDAYDFSCEGEGEIQETPRSIINASVLGLIFEKINGYRDGSFYTPGYITMYMSREAIRRAVVERFRHSNLPGLKKLTGFAELNDRLDSSDREVRKRANAIINKITVCDPAVGSGHFLVSALNELIAIKSELGLLSYRDNGDKIKEYSISVENDELIVTDKDTDQLFAYILNRNNRPVNELQRLQESLFHEKQNIIENCLFGVDINPKSVAICRLRLWIELLKNAYYTRESAYAELETLPNIDINIKCGNSLVSRFAITGTANVYATERYKLKAIIDRYKEKVQNYKQAPANKQILLKEIASLKESLQGFAVPTDPDLIALRKITNNLDQLGLGMVSEELEQYRAMVAQEEELKRLIADKKNTVYANAFEWRFEFPEVLDNEGEYVGFDLIIGNPPYGVNFSSEEKLLLKTSFSHIHVRTPESYNYFVGRFVEIANASGACGLIIPSSFLSQIEFEKTRKYLIDNHSINKIINLGDGIFHDVATPTCIIVFQIPQTKNKIIYNNLTAINRNIISESLDSNRLLFDSESIKQNDGYSFICKNNRSVIEKCYQNATLKQVAEEVATGISPGLGRAFIVDISKSTQLNLEPDLLKKLVIGGEINKFTLTPSTNKQIIYCTSNTDITKFTNCFSYLEKHREQLEKRVETLSGAIPWFVMLRPRRVKLFDNPKILIRQTANHIIAAYDDQGWYCLKSAIIVQLPDNSDIHYFYLLALLNSRLMDFIYRNLVHEDNRIFPEVKPIQLFKLPIKIANKLEQAPIIERVQKILNAWKSTPVTLSVEASKINTSALETEIDQLVYALYGLTEEEISLVEGKQ